ncbi:MAG: HAMP domain-containing histidine kinase [Rhodospirillales bacterium]|nr:HAMP domain-containing histidine kinase [Rhodospirillales bacterium]
MLTILDPVHWPIRVRIPLVVAGLMVVVSVAMTNVVLNRLSANQEQGLKQLANAYLDGVSTALFPHLVRKDVWEAFDILERATGHYAGLKLKHSVIALPDNSILAASDPIRFPVDTGLPAAIAERHVLEHDIVIDESNRRAWLHRSISENQFPLGNLYAEVDLSGLIEERQQVFWTLVGVNTFLTLLFAGMGYLIAWRMVRPLAVLASFVDQIRHGDNQPIPANQMPRKGSEYYGLFQRLNAMAEALRERQELAHKLANEEKLALLGKLASGIAHEVNNPLGGLMNAVDTMKTHGNNAEIRNSSLGLLERGLRGIRDVVRATLETYKDQGSLENLSRKHLEDLKYLIQHNLTRRQLRLEWKNMLQGDIKTDAQAVRQAVLNLLLNACAASPLTGTVSFSATRRNDILLFTISDTGPGIPEEVASLLEQKDPDLLPLHGETGLGVWLVNRLVIRLGGHCTVDAKSKKGTTIMVHIPIKQEQTIASA